MYSRTFYLRKTKAGIFQFLFSVDQNEPHTMARKESPQTHLIFNPKLRTKP